MKIFNRMDSLDLQDFILSLNDTLDLDINYNPVNDTLGINKDMDISVFQDVRDLSLLIKNKIDKKYK